jgi:hypothetical protein
MRSHGRCGRQMARDSNWRIRFFRPIRLANSVADGTKRGTRPPIDVRSKMRQMWD